MNGGSAIRKTQMNRLKDGRVAAAFVKQVVVDPLII